MVLKKIILLASNYIFFCVFYRFDVPISKINFKKIKGHFL
jgi:hypothetical protein